MSKSQWHGICLFGLRFVGVGIFIALLFETDWPSLAEITVHLGWKSLLVVVVGNVLALVLGMMRWVYLLQTQRIPVAPLRGFWIVGASFFLGVLTPGRAGELLKIAPLKWGGHGLVPLSFSVIAERVLDGVVVLASAGLGFWYINKGLFYPELWVWSPLAVGVLLLALYLQARLRNRIARLWGVGGGNTRLYEIVERLQKSLGELVPIKWKQWAIIVLLSICIWLVDYWLFHILARWAAVPISFVETVIVVSIASLITALPISIAGLGTRDLALIYVFEALGLPESSALTFSILFLYILICGLGIGFFCWLRVPIEPVPMGE